MRYVTKYTKKINDKVVVEAKRVIVDITNSKDKSKATWNRVNSYARGNKTIKCIKKLIY